MTLKEALESVWLFSYPDIKQPYFRSGVAFRRKLWAEHGARARRMALALTAYGLAFIMDWGEPEGCDEQRYSFMIRPDDVVADDWEVIDDDPNERNR